jgi:hypothetical protein
MSGLKSFLLGDNAKTAKEKMLIAYDEQIASLDADSWEAKCLVHNKESLLFEGDDNLTFFG